MGIRTFIALPMDEEVIHRLVEAQHSLADVEADVRWVEPVNLHLTLKFLGEIEDRQAADVCAVARDIAAETAPFEMTVKGLVSSPAAGQMRMIWANIEEPTDQLALLQEFIDEAFGGLGFKEENRQFRPHLTVARIKSGRNIPQLRTAVRAFHDTVFGRHWADHLIVFSSELTSDGPIYTPLATAEFGK
jgi:2'-5' RNA ligase